jgi:hypothetical protein
VRIVARSFASSLLLFAVVAHGCQQGATGPATGPAPTHFVDTTGSAHPELDPAWSQVESMLGSATPAAVTIQLTDDGISRFDGPSQRLLLDRANLARRGAELVGHELAHVTLHVLSNGASAQEPYRFLDEGFANIVGSRIDGSAEAYRAKALDRAVRELDGDRLHLSEVQIWSTFFGGPHTGRWWAYEVGSSFCFFVIDGSGEASLRRLFVEIGRARDLDEALRTAIGIGASDAEQRWFAYLRSERDRRGETHESRGRRTSMHGTQGGLLE